MIVIPKKDKTKSVVLDYGKLITVTIAQQWPVPIQQEILDAMGNNEWFSTLDLISGYWQIKMSEKSRDKTEFSTQDGRYQFRFSK